MFVRQSAPQETGRVPRADYQISDASLPMAFALLRKQDFGTSLQQLAITS
jgi:hypothetical protein